MSWSADEEVLRPPALRTPGSISVAEVDYSGAGTFGIGRAACTGYITEACRLRGAPLTHWLPGMLTIALRESSYNANLINLDDSNAVGPPVPHDSAHPGAPAGCSRGGWQCIPATFADNHVAGTSLSIYDPVANCAAAIGHIIGTYGIAADGHDLLTRRVSGASEDGFGIQQADPDRSPYPY
ncbi:hypothetical protein ABT095_20095 [Kitasatospora sp. NPDC002227]|uniref:hypothetical protein n=1 Tax=Kitasatospora sp. NPDC002227 TaxID=3154773 RepID=UPI00332F528E